MQPKTEEEVKVLSRVPYQSLTGSLMDMSASIRPDIAYTVSFLSQFNQCPGNAYWLSAKGVLCYLKGTSNCRLEFRRTGDALYVYVDANCGAGLDNRSSYTEYVFKPTGTAISCETRNHRTRV